MSLLPSPLAAAVRVTATVGAGIKGVPTLIITTTGQPKQREKIETYLPVTANRSSVAHRTYVSHTHKYCRITYMKTKKKKIITTVIIITLLFNSFVAAQTWRDKADGWRISLSLVRVYRPPPDRRPAGVSVAAERSRVSFVIGTTCGRRHGTAPPTVRTGCPRATFRREFRRRLTGPHRKTRRTRTS